MRESRCALGGQIYLVEFLIIKREFRLIELTTNTHECTLISFVSGLTFVVAVPHSCRFVVCFLHMFVCRPMNTRGHDAVFE